MLEQLAAPAVFPVSLAAAKDWLRETSADYDAVITMLIKTATARVEKVTHNALVYRPVREQFDYFAPMMELSGFPVLGVSSITYLDTAGVKQTLPAANYMVDTTKSATRITPAYALYFPPTRPIMNSVQVNYDVGVVVPASANPGTDFVSAPGAHKANGDIVQLSTDSGGTATPSGVVPAGLTELQAYYVVNANAAGDSFQLSLTSGGGVVDITGAGTPPFFVGLVPDEMLLAMRLMMGTWYDNPSDISTTQMYELPRHAAAENLLSPFQPRGF